MKLAPLFRECHINGPNGLWASYNNEQAFTCSPDGYLMALAPSRFSRLDDMNEREEKEFWDFTFTLASQGLADPEKRGVPQSRPIRESFEPCHVIVALNDGVVTWQTVGSVHGHILWASAESSVSSMNIEEALIEKRGTFWGGEDPYFPDAQAEIVLSPDHYSEQIRSARRMLADRFSIATDDGFSLYTKKPVMGDPRNGSSFVIEMWSEEKDSLISVSNALREWCGIRPANKDTYSRGLKYSCFERLPA